MSSNSSSKTIAKADIALDILLKYDEKKTDVSFRQVLNEILNSWRDLE